MTSQTQEMTFARTIFVPPSWVYAALTCAEGWCAWCCETAEAEAVLGGKLHIYAKGYNAYGEFTALEPDWAVAFTFNGDGEPPSIIDVRLDEHEGSTLKTCTAIQSLPMQAPFNKLGFARDPEWLQCQKDINPRRAGR